MPDSSTFEWSHANDLKRVAIEIGGTLGTEVLRASKARGGDSGETINLSLRKGPPLAKVLVSFD